MTGGTICYVLFSSIQLTITLSASTIFPIWQWFCAWSSFVKILTVLCHIYILCLLIFDKSLRKSHFFRIFFRALYPQCERYSNSWLILFVIVKLQVYPSHAFIQWYSSYDQQRLPQQAPTASGAVLVRRGSLRALLFGRKPLFPTLWQKRLIRKGFWISSVFSS